MATPTLTLVNHTSLTTADTNTGWNDLTTAEADIKVEGQNSMSGIFRANGEQGYYDSGGAPVTAVGKTLRGWINTTNAPYMDVEADGGYQLLAYDGSTEELKTIFGSDTYSGGWFNFVWDMDDFTTLTLANVDRWGVEAGHHTSAKNVTNAWMDVLRYLDGYSMTGGTTSDRIELVGIAALDKTSAYGVVSEFEGVYFATGLIQFGTGATTTWFEMDGEVLIFTDKPVAPGLYKIAGVGSGSTVVIVDSVLRSTGSTDATRFIVDFDDADLLSLTFTGNLVVRAGTVAFKAGQSVTDNTFDDCGQITPAGADLRRCDVANYEGTVDTGAVSYDEAADPAGEFDDMSFTRGAASTHAISFGTSSPLSITLNGIAFNGYSADNAQTDSTLYFARTGGAVTVNLSGVTGNVSYKTAGATITLVSASALQLTGLQNPSEVRVYDAGTTTELTGQEDVSTGVFSSGIDSAVYPLVDISVLSLGYQNLRLLDIDMSEDVSIPVLQVIDRQYENPSDEEPPPEPLEYETSASGFTDSTTTQVVPKTGSVDSLMVVQVMGSGASATITTPSGWTRVTPVDGLTNNDYSTEIAYRVIQDGDPASWSWTSSASVNMSYLAVAVSGVDTADPVDDSGYAVSAAGAPAPSVTTTEVDTLLVVTAGEDISTGGGFTIDSGTEVLDVTVGTDYLHQGAYHDPQAVAEATSRTVTSDDTGQDTHAAIVAVKAAP